MYLYTNSRTEIWDLQAREVFGKNLKYLQQFLHVAVVEAVNEDTITVSQGGMGRLSDASHGYCIISTMSRAKLESQGGCGTFYGYVYMDSSAPIPNGTTYYPSCSSSHTSIVSALQSIGVDSSFSNRSSIAAINGISNYSGTSDQNVQMLNLLKQGRLIKPKGNTAQADTTAPTITDIKITDKSSTGYTVHCIVRKNRTVRKTISVKKKKTYYVRICTYKGNITSEWNTVKKLKIKR